MIKKTIFTSFLTIILCLSLIIGGTFAISTSESSVNIAVTSAKINVIATIDKDSLQTKSLTDASYATGEYMYGGKAVFTNENEDLNLSNLAEGDGVKFNIKIVNESTITVKYRTVISCINDDGLFAGLVVNIDSQQNYNGEEYYSDWEFLEVGDEVENVEVSIELPNGAGKDFEGKTCTITYRVEAVQGNAYTGPEAIVTRYEQADLPVRTTIKGNLGGIEFPTTVPDEITVEAAWTFTATDDDETIQTSPYKDWICDFVIECDQKVEKGELGLWGKYGVWDLAFGNPIALPEEQSLFMLTSVGMPQTYYNICTAVKEFNCGVFRGLAGEQPMQGKTITVSLCLVNPMFAVQLIQDVTEIDVYNEVTGEIDTSEVSFEDMLKVMEKKNWKGAIGKDVLIASQTKYTFN